MTNARLLSGAAPPPDAPKMVISKLS